MATALLVKAESSKFTQEQGALALRAYRELAVYLNDLESDTSTPRKRDRRLLVDRRAGGGSESGAAESGGSEGGTATDNTVLAAARRAYRGAPPAGRAVPTDDGAGRRRIIELRL